MEENKEILQVKDLAVAFQTYRGKVKAVRNVSFDLKRGQALGIVGESGCGKSVTAHAIMGLLPKENSIIENGQILWQGQDLVNFQDEDLAKIRGNKIAMIFQDPMTSLNPVLTIGTQIKEVLFLHKQLLDKEATEKAVELLNLVGIPFAQKRLKDYPHQFSGGMRQRVMIAMALACEPELLKADEPTTALDVTIQAQILELMQSLQEKLGMAIIMVTHDLGVIASMCDEIIVMYGGRVCERGTADAIFYSPAHEYTKGLLRSIPTKTNSKTRLVPIGGTPINMLNMPKGCAFCPRCDAAMKICLTEKPEEIWVGEDHLASCWMNIKNMMEEGKSNE